MVFHSKTTWMVYSKTPIWVSVASSHVSTTVVKSPLLLRGMFILSKCLLGIPKSESGLQTFPRMLWSGRILQPVMQRKGDFLDMCRWPFWHGRCREMTKCGVEEFLSKNIIRTTDRRRAPIQLDLSSYFRHEPRGKRDGY